MHRPSSLRDELTWARAETDKLFAHIAPGALYERPVAERHRLIFYLGHLEAFDWNLLAVKASGERRFNSSLDLLFERGIDPEPGKAPVDTPADWPSEEEVRRYGKRTRQWIDRRLEDLDPATLQMAIEHRHMHAETFAYLMHNLPYSKKAGGPVVDTSARAHPPNPMLDIAESQVTLGSNPESFGWDNERLAHTVQVPPFRISKYKISNGDYLQFMRETNASPPHFWNREGDGWIYRGMFGNAPLPADHPVWLTWAQAKAFADWRGLGLPTEAQYQVAAGLSRPDWSRDNFGSARFDPVAVNHGTNGGNAPCQLVGNGWEWTRDIFAPYEGFEPHPYYAGYSADFFDNQHYVLKGASPRTAALLTRPSFRNWFRPEYPYMYAGFRLVED